MAFDKAQPQDTTKIRNLGVVIRPNWVAIEEGDSTFRPYAINLQNRTPLPVSNDPTNIADTSIFYVKDDGSGNPEAYVEDGSANVVQLTEGGRLGGPSTNIKMNNYRFGSSTVDYGRNNIVSSWVRWNNAGTALSSFGCSIAKLATGVYQVTFATTRNNTSYVAVATPFNEGNARMFKIGDITTSTFRIYGINEDNSARDVGGYCMVVGGF